MLNYDAKICAHSDVDEESQHLSKIKLSMKMLHQTSLIIAEAIVKEPVHGFTSIPEKGREWIEPCSELCGECKNRKKEDWDT